MSNFPASLELVVFVSTIGVLIALGLAITHSRWYVRPQAWQRIRSLWLRFTFPRRLVRPDLSVREPLRRVKPRYVWHRFRFTLFMLFLNVYTFVFTTDMLTGEINPRILENQGFSYANFAQHKWFILVTANFVHFHLAHLAANMAMLILFCGSLESLLGSGFAAAVYLISMNANVPNGLFLLPALRMFYPEVWRDTVQFVDVGASLGIVGCLGGLAALLRPRDCAIVLGVVLIGTVGGVFYVRNLFGLDHACSALLGYATAFVLLRNRQRRLAALPAELDKFDRLAS